MPKSTVLICPNQTPAHESAFRRSIVASRWPAGRTPAQINFRRSRTGHLKAEVVFSA